MKPRAVALLAALTAGAGVAASPIHPGEPTPSSSDLSHAHERLSDVRDTALKCKATAEIPGYASGTVLVVVDGQVLDPPDEESEGPRMEESIGFEADEISSVQIRCWSPELRRFLGPSDRAGAWHPSWNVIVVHSLAAHHEAAAPLVELARAQEAHLRINQRFAVTPEELEPFGFDPASGVEITVTEGNWTAVTSGTRLFEPCTVGSTVSGEEFEGLLEPSCAWSEDTVSAALARWADGLEDAAGRQPRSVPAGK